MHISAKGSYGLRAVLDLALHYGQGRMQSADIAARQNIPESYLVQLLNLLRNGGLVRSIRGPKGGHVLLKRPEDVTVKDVVVLLEGPIDLVGKGEDQTGEEAGLDVFREVWSRVEAAIEDVLTSVTFEDLCRKHRMPRANFTFRI